MEEGRTFQTERTEMRERPCLTFWAYRESDVARAGMQIMSRPELVAMVTGEGGSGRDPGPLLQAPHLPRRTVSPGRLPSGVQRIWKSPRVCQLGRPLRSVWPEPTSQAPTPSSRPSSPPCYLQLRPAVLRSCPLGAEL